ncbi:MAG TPA: SAM-dependent methyltransferase [Rariglobus sp.]|jgi:tRNA (guanine-N7-)-methyltransferase|nr:SAM-dependent methyltransferase [Rariglobus sp.]
MPLEIAQALNSSRLAEIRAQLAPLLPTTQPITLEIGSGHGHFLTAYAAAHPNRFCIGIDLIADRLDRSVRKSNRAKLKNIAWVRAEALLFLEALPADIALAEIFVLFSDPWPKRRHWKNRVLQPEFLSLLASRAGQGARLHFRTDHAPYFQQATDFINQHPDWSIGAEDPWPFELATVFQQRAAGHQSLIARKT